MTENYVLLETIELTQSAASVTFDNIPQTGYTDLVLKMSSRQNLAQIYGVINIQFNGTGGTAYSYKVLQGSGSAASSTGLTSTHAIYGVYSDAGANATANTFSNIEMYIPNYTSSNYKSVSLDQVSENNATAANAILNAGLWSNTSAINSITLSNGGSGASFVQYATFSLYGVAALGTEPTITPLATGGNIVANDGTYWYHAFLSSGSFTPQNALSCDVLVVAGGGGSGFVDMTGGGGAGGVFHATAQSLSSGTKYTATVGSGGSKQAIGGNSTFASLTAAVGGGYGGDGSGTAGVAGGSGGGAGRNGFTPGASTQTSTGGTGYGNAGGPAGGNAYYDLAGSGGGAGAAGTGRSTTASPANNNGGIGISVFSSWGLATGTGDNRSGTVYYAGGGGVGGYQYPAAGTATGSQGGFGGGGAGGASAAGGSPGSTGTAGSPNTGGGGGGGSAFAGAGAAGGSGIVIIRYAMA
jgi:hypothetical protein